jgi:hypothetical protein
VICFATPRWSTPIMVGTSWPIAFIVWWLLWQWKAQSPSSSARKSICRIWPTAMSAVTSYWRVLFGVGPAVGAGDQELVPVQVDRVVGHRQVADADAHLVHVRTTSGSMPGKMRLFQLHRLKSSIVMIFGVALPGSMS